MSEKQTPTTGSEWKTGVQAWDTFTDRYPELGMRKGKWAFHNFLRVHRRALECSDAIRKARKRFWVAHQERFCSVAFDCATGHVPRTAALNLRSE